MAKIKVSRIALAISGPEMLPEVARAVAHGREHPDHRVLLSLDLARLGQTVLPESEADLAAFLAERNDCLHFSCTGTKDTPLADPCRL